MFFSLYCVKGGSVLEETKEYHLSDRKKMLFLYHLYIPVAIFTVIFFVFLAFYMSSLMAKFLIIDFVLVLCFIGLSIFFSAYTSYSVSLKKKVISVKVRNLNVEIKYNLIDEVKIIEDKFFDKKLTKIYLKSTIEISRAFLILGLLTDFRMKTEDGKRLIIFSVVDAQELYEDLQRIIKEKNE